MFKAFQHKHMHKEHFEVINFSFGVLFISIKNDIHEKKPFCLLTKECFGYILKTLKNILVKIFLKCY